MPPAADAPDFVVHYTWGEPFRSMMELDDAARRALLRAGAVSHPQRYDDPTYVDTWRRCEARMYEQLVAAGGAPLARHPHYALMGRSRRAEARLPQTGSAWACPLSRLPARRVSFTWDDSFLFDPAFRALCGRDHPASGQLYTLDRLDEVLERWGPTTDRPAWQWLEFQLWYTPAPGDFQALDRLAPA